MHKKLFLLVLFMGTFWVTNLFSQQNDTNSISIVPDFLDTDSSWADSMLKSLSPEERIAQLIMAAAYPNKDSIHYNQIIQIIQNSNVGGVIIFQGGAVRTAQFINKLQASAKIPLIAGIDGEWGLSMRTDSTLNYPKQIMLGAIKNNDLIYQMGCDIATQLHRMGLHTNFSPVVDINNNPKNPVINSRSFGENKTEVSDKALKYMSALQDNRIIATAKHFPGHGDTETDSHLDLPLLPFTRERLDTLELYPFKKLINKGVTGIMVAHLNVPSLDSSGLPSTLSKKIIDSLLIHKLGFKGLVFTDALIMKGVSKLAPSNIVALDAFLAGNDILLMPDDIPGSIYAIKKAADSGIISYGEIDRRCKKVLMAKYWLGLNNYKPTDINNLYDDLHLPRYELTIRKLVEEGLTVIQNNNEILPLKKLDALRIACVSIGSTDTSTFQKTCALYADMDFFSINRADSDSVFLQLYNSLKKYNLIIAGLVNTDMRATKNFGLTEKCINFLSNLADSNNVILDLFANPYALNKFQNTEKFKAVIISYEDKELNQDLSAQLIFGGVVPKGHLSVNLSEKFENGYGLYWDKPIRFKYTIPEELGIDSKSLLPIDSLIKDAIAQKAIPGCEVLLAKDGKIFMNKAYGYFTYDSIRKVKPSDIYDLASITKIGASTPAIMMLYDKHKLSLNDKLSKYYSPLNKSNKKKIIFKDVLAHQARLLSYEPYYLNTLTCINPAEKLVSQKPVIKNAYKVSEGMYINCDTKYKDSIFSKNYTTKFPNIVSDSLFISNAWQDSIMYKILNSELYPKAEYHYSDLGFILLGKAVESIIYEPLNTYLERNLYKKLGASTMQFKPLKHMSKENIAPTEYDLAFRKSLIRGYVHDPTAAMLGGVCGHAGLFSNANDLAKLMQMFLNNGVYGGEQFIKPKTIELFNTRPYIKNKNRRGLGFDKPEPDETKKSPVNRLASLESFGHSGFTGTLTWADPKYNLLYVFLSNRVYPNASENKLADINLRTNIQEVVYKAIIK